MPFPRWQIFLFVIITFIAVLLVCVGAYAFLVWVSPPPPTSVIGAG